MRAPLLLALPLLGLLSACSEPYDPQPLASNGSSYMHSDGYSSDTHPKAAGPLSMADTSGAYFYVDEQSRVVIADAEQHNQRVVHHQDESGAWSFEAVDNRDLSDKVPQGCVKPANSFLKNRKWP